MKRLLIVATVLAMSTPALALDFTTKLTTLDGADLQDQQGKPDPTSLAKVAENALLTVYPDEATDPKREMESAHRYGVAKTIHDNPKDPKLSIEDLALVKKLILKAYAPLIGGQAAQLIDPSLVK
jgi:hypothetical protein